MNTVELSVDPATHVAHLWLARPDAANALNIEMAGDVHSAVREIEARGDVRVVLLRGQGKMFCGGGDVKAFADDPGLIERLLEIWHPAVLALLGLDAPVISAVQGSAAGAGLGLVVASDLVLAARSCRFVMAYTGIGLTPDGSSSWFLTRLVGHRRAAELTLLNRVLSAEQAESWGIVNIVVDDDALDAEAEKLAARLGSGPTLAYGRARRLLQASWANTLPDHLALEAREMALSSQSVDGREGITAFAARRPPNFTGA